jgi:signal transduction histidine kinase
VNPRRAGESARHLRGRHGEQVASNVKQNGITGTGLGLAIVKDLVERYEGRISVHGTVGEGTTFTVVLPMAR